MTSPILSVVVPAYNVSKYVEECIVSILRQTLTNIEIVVINDGSTDNTSAILHRKFSTDNRVKIIDKQNEGVSVARNEGIKFATGKYIMFVDGDDFISPDCCEYFVNIISNFEADIAISLNCYTKTKEPQIRQDKIEELSPEEATALLLSPRIIVGCWNKIFRREFLLDNQLKFDSALFYGEGLRFITQASQHAKKIVTGRRKVYFYRRNNYSSATSKFDVSKLKNGEKALELISQDLRFEDKSIHLMLNWHICQFKMGVILRLKEAKKEKDYYDYYAESLKYTRRNFLEIVRLSELPIYKRLLILGTAISPALMAKLDIIRRRYISNNSVKMLQPVL